MRDSERESEGSQVRDSVCVCERETVRERERERTYLSLFP